MAKNSKVVSISVDTHSGEHFVTVKRSRTDGGKDFFITSASFVSMDSVRRAQRAQLVLLPQGTPWQERSNAWKRER